MTKFRYRDAVALAKLAIAEQGPDFVYGEAFPRFKDNCQYVVDGAPSCIVGHIFSKIGVSLSWMHEKEGTTVDDFFEDPDFFAHLNPTKKARFFLGELQGAQDNGLSWGESLKQAREITKYAAERNYYYGTLD